VSRAPRVSICMPAFDAAPWIRGALESALAQTYRDFELVVSDNASSDGTAEIAGSYSDPRVRIHTASHTVAAVVNHNRAIRLCRGEFVKFLHADDLLLPECLEQMVALAADDESVGLVFAPREVVVEDAPDPDWLEHFQRPHEGFGPLARINEGRTLFNRLLDAEFEENWVGEPSAVLVRRSALQRVGLLNERLFQISDLELWARILLRHRVGFIDAALSVYRHHGASGTVANARVQRDWLDRPWLVEGLLRVHGLTDDERARLLRLRRAVARRALRAQLRRLARGSPTTGLLVYAWYRARQGLGRAPALAPALDGTTEGLGMSERTRS
jgi:glycosyltransferase involved in cell wall biosynthesis